MLRSPAVSLLSGLLTVVRGAVVLAASAGALRGAEAAVPSMLLLDGVVAGTAIVAVGERGTILRSTDNAASWQRAATSAQATLTGVSFADPQRGWAVGHDALIVATTDAGATWTKQYQGENLQDSFLDVIAIDADRAIAVGAYGLFASTADAGRTWVTRKISDDDYHLNRVTRGPTGTLYIAGERGTLLRSTDHGATWTKIAAPYDGSFYGVAALDGRTLLAHGLRGNVFRSINDGAAWERVSTPQPALLATAIKLRSNVIVIAGQARAWAVSRDYGKTIESFPVPIVSAVSELLELPNGSVLVLGEAGATVMPAPK